MLQEKSLIEEVIRYARLRNGYSQEELSEGICTPETLSRIETGKRNPTIKNFYALMEKLKTKLGYYNTDFVVEHFETLEKISELKKHSIYKRWNIVEQLIKEIEAEIDMSNIINQQEIGLFHTILDCHFHRITTEEAMERIESLLKLSVEQIDGKFILPCFPTSVEVALFNQIGVFYQKKNQQQEAINVLMSIYEYFHQGKLEAPEYNQRYFMILTNLACCLEELGELEKAMELMKEGIKIGITYNIARRIAANLIEIGYIEERMGKEQYLKTYEKAYYLAELFGDFVNQKNLILHLEEIGKPLKCFI